MPKLKKQLNRMARSFAAAKGRGPQGQGGDVTTGEFRPARAVAAGGVGAGGGGLIAMRKRQVGQQRRQGQPQPPLTTAGIQPEVAAAAGAAVKPAQPNQAPIPGAGEMGPMPRGVQDAGAGAGGALTRGAPVTGTTQPQGRPFNLAQRFANRGAGEQRQQGQPLTPAGTAPGMGAAPMMNAYMARRSNLPPGFQAAAGGRRRKGGRFFTGA